MEHMNVILLFCVVCECNNNVKRKFVFVYDECEPKYTTLIYQIHKMEQEPIDISDMIFNKNLHSTHLKHCCVSCHLVSERSGKLLCNSIRPCI